MISGITNLRGNVKRVDQIVRILGKYGLGNFIGEKTPDFIQRRFVSAEGIAVRDYPVEVRVRMALTMTPITGLPFASVTRPVMAPPLTIRMVTLSPTLSCARASGGRWIS